MTQSKGIKLSGIPRELGTIQENLSNRIDLIASVPILNGILLKDIVLTAGTPVLVDHKLRRPPLGWYLIDNSANAVVWRTDPLTANNISLNCSVNTTVSLWVF